MSELEKIGDCKYRLPKTGRMRVPGIIYASQQMISGSIGENVLAQVANVASLPGIVARSIAMPDVHLGYGMPIGGVAAFDLNRGIISPGAIGYDINCGVRLLVSGMNCENIESRKKELLQNIASRIPAGIGSRGAVDLKESDLKRVLTRGAEWTLSGGYAQQDDLDNTEENGTMKEASWRNVSKRAMERGKGQLGTLGAGNHFIELQIVSEIYNKTTADAWGIFPGQVTVMIHTGSRGLGYQVCDDYLKVMQKAVSRYKIDIRDRQLACAPYFSDEGKRYFSAMAAAANYAWCNRQIITAFIRESFLRVFSPEQSSGLKLVWDVAHNIGKVEKILREDYIVHRKGATRALPPHHPCLPDKYKETGQPVIVPGSMGTESYLLSGVDSSRETFFSACHGAGRRMSRRQALRTANSREIVERLKKKGIEIISSSPATVAEEAPAAYKDVNEVVNVCERAGIAARVARMRPVGVIKG